MATALVSRQSPSPSSCVVEMEARALAGSLGETLKLTGLQSSSLWSSYSSWWPSYQPWAGAVEKIDNHLVLPSRAFWGCCLPFLVKSSWSPAITPWGRSWTCWPSLTAPSTSSCTAWCPRSSEQLSSPTSDPRPPGPEVAICPSKTAKTKPRKRR